MRLSAGAVARLSDSVSRPAYDRQAQKTGIVHLGIGAFHRAHQAVYTDDAMMAGDRDWAITGVSLRSRSVRDQLAPQDGFYTVTERGGGQNRTRLVGAVRDVVMAPDAPDAVVAMLAAPDTQIVTVTVTEKGYARRTDGALDVDAVERPGDPPRTLYGFLAAGLARRRAAGLPGITIVSCDNIAENGTRLAGLTDQFLDRVDPLLAAWARAECAFPSTMVDRIVPAMAPDDHRTIAAAIGLDDAGAVITEPFRQWVIEDRFAGSRPRWEAGGAQFVDDVRPYESAKLRMLNGAHSALAYLGLAAGHRFVHEAVSDPDILPLIERLMRREAAASLTLAPHQDTDSYADALQARFANAALPHRLAQIAMDGSQKIGPRWLEPLAINRAAGRDCGATLTALAAWIVYIRGDAGPVDDPLADRLAALWCVAGTHGIVTALFGEQGLFAPIWTASSVESALLAHLVATRADKLPPIAG